jgi:hypothetical protein
MVQISIEYTFEIELEKETFESDFHNLRNTLEDDPNNFVLSNENLLKNVKIFYDLIEEGQA